MVLGKAGKGDGGARISVFWRTGLGYSLGFLRDFRRARISIL